MPDLVHKQLPDAVYELGSLGRLKTLRIFDDTLGKSVPLTLDSSLLVISTVPKSGVVLTESQQITLHVTHEPER